MNTMAYSNIFKSITKYDESYLDNYEYDKGVIFCRTFYLLLFEEKKACLQMRNYVFVLVGISMHCAFIYKNSCLLGINPCTFDFNNGSIIPIILFL